MKKERLDMTQGRPLELLLRFSMPLMLGSLFQQLYSFVDTAIVGRCISLVAFGSGVMEILGRAVGGWLAVYFGSFVLICLSNPIARGFAMVYCAVASWVLVRRKEREFAAG